MAADSTKTIRDTGDPAPVHREVHGDVPTAGDLEAAIAHQVRMLRRNAGMSVADMAAKVGISKAMLSKIENAQTSCSLSTLARLAAGLDVPVTSLFRGADVEREAIYTEAGKGAVIVGRGTRVGHHYELLGGLRGQHKRLEPVLVTLTDDSEVFPRFQHPGTEMLYMLEGVMVYGHGNAEYTLRPGDCLLLDGEGIHGPHDLVRLPIRFLAVTAYPDNHDTE
ncbi:helix-turn-helix domain-containing protein [Gordonia sp. HNM0687]|uniref:Helix-turn-helix domain-containing protein n=1 Tax=Gordonia mangrovi TaxID=2665643 RepID=A0A6L7GNA8_9ACTN|nr:XRE family transcriptional regulator [Gordonia mangrovi]MXP21419.1 helix-turn-helix domain-containing protein [Gordonia mangrovi]UVF80168.1 XRE family transcriptional regulator [Gordonia mangrovi]